MLDLEAVSSNVLDEKKDSLVFSLRVPVYCLVRRTLLRIDLGYRGRVERALGDPSRQDP